MGGTGAAGGEGPVGGAGGDEEAASSSAGCHVASLPGTGAELLWALGALLLARVRRRTRR